MFRSLVFYILIYITAKVHSTDNNGRYYDYSDVDNVNNNVTETLNIAKERNPILKALRDLEQHISGGEDDIIQNKFNNFIENFDEDEDNIKQYLRSNGKSRQNIRENLKDPFKLFSPPIKTTAQKSELINKYDGRRILGWFHNLFRKNEEVISLTTTPKTITMMTSKSSTERSIENNVIATLNKLITILKHTNVNILKLLNSHENLSNETKIDGYFILKVPVTVTKVKSLTTSLLNRSKRHALSNTIERNKLEALNTNVTFEMNGFNKTEGTEKIKPTRKYLNLSNGNAIKLKLVAFLNDSFNELKDKMTPLIKIKHDYAEDNTFKIGYVVANIDTLEANLNKLRKDVEINRHIWDNHKILDLLDKLKVFNNVVSNLLQSLKYYVQKLRY